MRSRALTGTTEGSFDNLRVRDPATGLYEDVLSLIGSSGGSGGGSSYDDTALTSAVAVNTLSISNRSTSTTAALAGKVNDRVQKRLSEKTIRMASA